ncbi:hypothetical protein PACTADRAFT_48139 [Pachysolen tannophilus NRRL Y-2460]|uniref:Golgi apparatus membrane protein TVP23 n=1 Tax=Pachysolen tannophilus NRRL Y-2460 TaxID=669874 RepID=A0A1E4U2X8_PACTA|nr:hypothetical protein PACTADRAFT_48139 [Pachysolen tannophilus NRRL Y-2460]
MSAQGTNIPLEPQNNNNAGGMTLYQRLSESSHPVALIFYLLFRIGSLLTYLLGLLFTNNFILEFILVLLLLAADFWNVKNISGRLLVGLRWWNETNEIGESIWVFETVDPNRYINPIDTKVFWIFLYGAPIFWIVLGVLAILKFEFLSLILVMVAVTLTSLNALAFTKCDKFSKANDITSGVFGNALGRFNPFNKMFG